MALVKYRPELTSELGCGGRRSDQLEEDLPLLVAEINKRRWGVRAAHKKGWWVGHGQGPARAAQAKGAVAASKCTCPVTIVTGTWLWACVDVSH